MPYKDKQSRIDRLLNRLSIEESMHRRRIDILQERRNKLIKISHKIKAPHALIPKSYATIDEWLDDCTSFPQFIIQMIFDNKAQAVDVSYCCNTYQSDFHIVKCKAKDYYYKKYINKQP